jgi:hypothetical protein
MLRALVQRSPASRYVTGFMGRWFFKPISHLPDKMRDALLYSLSFGSAGPPAGLAMRGTEGGEGGEAGGMHGGTAGAGGDSKEHKRE